MTSMRSTHWYGTPQHWNPTERAQRERNIFMLRCIRKVSSRGQLLTKPPQNFNNLVLSCIQEVCKVLSHNDCSSSQNSSCVTSYTIAHFFTFFHFVATWHGCYCEKSNKHCDSKFHTTFECTKKLSCWSFEVFWLKTDLGSWLYVYSATWKCCVLVVRVP